MLACPPDRLRVILPRSDFYRLVSAEDFLAPVATALVTKIRKQLTT